MSSPKPPYWALKLFRWYCHPDLRSPIEGDLMELYEERVQASGKRMADWKFIRDILLLLRKDIIKPAEGTHRINTYGMFKNYFKVGIRNILKYKAFSFINIFGLAMAMSVCMLIILMLADQKGYDQFHKKKDRIYRILGTPEKGSTPYATVPFPLSETLKNEYPIIENSVLLRRGFGGDATYNDKTTDLRGYFASESLFEILEFPLIKGNKNTALSAPNSIVITSSKAYQLFNTENPVGKHVQFSDRGLSVMDLEGDQPPVDWGVFTITGVIDNSSFKSHLKFDAFASSSTLPLLYKESLFPDISQQWESYWSTYTYVLLKEDVEQEQLDIALAELSARKYKEHEGLEDYMLKSQNMASLTPGGIINNEPVFRLPMMAYYILSGLALIIMIMACLNYTNLSIARALTRMREIGVRKVNGATRSNLIFQFLTESLITALFSLLLAMLMLFFTKEAFMDLWFNQYLNFDLQSTPLVLMVFMGMTCLIGIFAGIYPALFLSKKLPVKALKNTENSTSKWGMQKVLNITQFVVSLLFIVTSMVIYKQFQHYANFEYGFDAENIVNIPLQSNDYEIVRNELSSTPGVVAVSACEYIPATGTTDVTNLINPENKEEPITLLHMKVNEAFLTNIDVKIIAGEGLPATGQTDRFFVINESALSKLGYENPHEAIGQMWATEENQGEKKIVGVVEDFRNTLLLNGDDVRPTAFTNDPSDFNFLNVRITEGNPQTVLAELERKWNTIDPQHAFRYDFFTNELANTNMFIFDIVSIIGYLSTLAILIACLGMLGMATYSTERRTKEIGIRKVLGAEELKIVLLLSRSFLKLLFVAVLIAAPLSYFINNLWLENLANRIELGFGTIAMGSFTLLFLGLLTIGSQTIRAARQNPVESLKDE